MNNPGVEFTVEQYRDALKRLIQKDKIDDVQRKILQKHCESKDFIDTEKNLARKLGPEIDFNKVNANRRALGKKIGEELEYTPKLRENGTKIWWVVWCKELEDSNDGLVLQLHSNFVEAALELKFVHLDNVISVPLEVDGDGEGTWAHNNEPENEESNHYDEMRSYEEQAHNHNVPETTRKAVIDSRLGQGLFRRKLIDYWGSCSVTSCSIIEILRASHIKPWRDCDDYERLYEFNGLLLIPNLDILFDKWLISFDIQGRILISKNISDKDVQLMGLDKSMLLRTVEDKHQPFLKLHRQEFHRQEKLRDTK